MILAFNKMFIAPIINGAKIHTIREDKTGRWKPQRKIQMATGVRSKNYNMFCEAECTGIQTISICALHKTVMIQTEAGLIRVLSKKSIEELAKNDGFKDATGFWLWFNQDFEGKIIHWTDYRY